MASVIVHPLSTSQLKKLIYARRLLGYMNSELKNKETCQRLEYADDDVERR